MFVSFEGIEGSGKTTLISLLQKELQKRNISSIHTREPGGSVLGVRLRKILLDTTLGNISPVAELHLFLADRAQHTSEVIQPALSQGQWVLCDRFADSTIAYQVFGRGLKIVQKTEDVCELMPDLTFLLDLPVEDGLRRAKKRNSLNPETDESRFDDEKKEFHQKVRNGFLSLARRYPGRIKILDARKPLSTLVSECLEQFGLR